MMKKFLTMVLALVMVLGCMTPALAASYPATPEPVPDLNDEAFWEQRMREERKEMGMPYPDGINVRLDAKYLTFKSARPIFRAGRVMAPAAELLAQLGGKVTVAKGNISATFPDGSSIRFTMGDKILHAKNSVESASLNMDAPPYYDVKTKTTYIPLRNVADALDLDIEWDDDYKVVYLTDWAKLAKDTDKEFSVLNTILAASAQAVTDKEKTYSSKDSVSLSGSLYKENGSDTATMSFGGESLVKGNQFCGDYTAKLELGGFRDLFAASLDEKQMKLLDNFKSGGYSVRGDLHGGTLYMKGSNLAALSENAIPSNTWIQLAKGDDGMGTLLHELEGMMAEMHSEPISLGALLVQLRQDAYRGWMQSPYDDFQNSLMPYRFLFADDCFKISTSGDTTTYTAKANFVTLLARGIKLGLKDQWTEMEQFLGVKGLSYELTVQVRGGKIVGMKTDGVLDLKAPVPMVISFRGQSDGLSGAMTFDIKGEYIGKIEMKMTSAVSETTKPVLTAPDKGEKVLLLEDLLTALMEKELPAAA